MKIRMKLFKIVFFSIICDLLIGFPEVRGQILKDESFVFKQINKTLQDTSKIPKWIKRKNVIINREYLENSFIDHNIIYFSMKSASIEFKIDSLGWLIHDSGIWKRFFIESENKIESVLLKNNYWISPENSNEMSLINNCFIFSTHQNQTIENDGLINQTIEYDGPLYWFHPKYGIVIIELMEIAYIRDDFFKIIKYE